AIRLGQLANNLLELSRIEAGPTSGRIDWRTLVDELTDAIDRARLLASNDVGLPGEGDEDARTISVDFDYDPRRRPPPAARVALPPTDCGRIRDTLRGSAAPAPRPAPPGSPRHEDTIAAELAAEEHEVILTVRDSGPGMPEDFLPVALDRFTRADNARTSQSG